MEITDAFLNPAWITKFTVEFSKDKVRLTAAAIIS